MFKFMGEFQERKPLSHKIQRLSFRTTMVSRLALSRLAPLLTSARTTSSALSRPALCRARFYATSENDHTVRREKPCSRLSPHSFM